jgi:hypothetical protein
MTECACPECTLPASSPKLKATRLLHSHLTPLQRRQLQETTSFVVKGGKTGTAYQVSANGYVNGYCIAPAGPLPLADRVLALKLLIECDEETFQTVAGSSHRTWTPAIQAMLDGRFGVSKAEIQARRGLTQVGTPRTPSPCGNPNCVECYHQLDSGR